MADMSRREAGMASLVEVWLEGSNLLRAWEVEEGSAE